MNRITIFITHGSDLSKGGLSSEGHVAWIGTLGSYGLVLNGMKGGR